MATILFELGHPKHYLQFRHPLRELATRHDVRVAARDKDVLLDLLRADGVDFVQFTPNRGGLRRKLTGIPTVLRDYARVLRGIRPDMIVSRSSPYAAVLGRMFGARTLVFPDSEGVPINEHFVVPLSSYVVTSASFEREYGRRHHRLGGIFEAGYLHPTYFTPDAAIRDALGVRPDERYAILRFVAWSANHDVRRHGIADTEKATLVRELASRMTVFISSEKPLPPELDAFRLPVPPSRMHDALAFADLYVGDSQTMATEAALLGTPSVRCNSFVGPSDFSNFRNLQSAGLLFNEATFAGCLRSALQVADDAGSKQLWSSRRDEYLRTVGDINMQTVRVIESCLPGLMSSPDLEGRIETVEAGR